MYLLLLSYYKWIIIPLVLIVLIFAFLLVKKRKQYWKDIEKAEYVTVSDEIEETSDENEFSSNENDRISAKTIKKIIISAVILCVSFVAVFTVASVLMYKDCFGYVEDKNMIDDYFDDITKFYVLNKVEEKYPDFYTDNYIDVIKELAGYEYTLVSRDETIAIIRDKSAENASYKVYLHLVSITADCSNVVHNIIYFEYKNKSYALLLFYDSEEKNYIYDYITLYSVDCKQLPEEFNDEKFKNNNLISNHNKSTLELALKNGAEIASIAVSVELCVMLTGAVLRYSKKRRKE